MHIESSIDRYQKYDIVYESRLRTYKMYNMICKTEGIQSKIEIVAGMARHG